jgi:hypothetical protein
LDLSLPSRGLIIDTDMSCVLAPDRKMASPRDEFQRVAKRGDPEQLYRGAWRQAEFEESPSEAPFAPDGANSRSLTNPEL